MKKNRLLKLMLSLILIFSMALTLFGCYKSTVTDDTNDGELVFEYDFHKYIEDTGFSVMMGESKLNTLLSNYTYEGKSISEKQLGMYADGFDGGGYSTGNDFFGCKLWYNVNKEEQCVIDETSFTAKVPIEGFELPCGITFDDSVFKALEKLKVNIFDECYLSTYKDDSLTIFEDAGASLKLKLNDAKGYDLIYTESYPSITGNGKPATMINTFEIPFSADNYKPCGVKIHLIRKSYFEKEEVVIPVFKTAQKYLMSKYEEKFVLVSNEEDGELKISVFADSEGRKCTVKEEDGIFTDNYSSVWFDENGINYVNEYFSTIKANKAKAFIITESVFLPYEKKFHDLYDYLQEFNVVIFTTQDNSIYDFLADTIRDYFEGCTVLGNIYSVTEEYYANVTEYEEAINALDSATFRILNGEYTHKSWDN